MTTAKHRVDLKSAIITVMVGPSGARRTFSVHESLLIDRSTFFRKALNQHEKKGQDRTVRLQASEEVFSLYLNVLYAGHMEPKENTPVRQVYTLRARLYLLAAFLDDQQTKNMAIAEMQNKTDVDQYPNEYLSMANIIYNGTAECCGGRRLIIDLFLQSRFRQAAIDRTAEYYDLVSQAELCFHLDLSFLIRWELWIDRDDFLLVNYGEADVQLVKEACDEEMVDG